MSQRNFNKFTKGFTLVELMIVVAIIAIIAAIAFPSYQRYILRSHRVDARNMMQDIAQKIQQNYSINRTYEKDSDGNIINDATLTTWGLNRSPASGTVRYNISFKTAPSANGYTLQAIPQGVQTKDECGTFTINQRGAKTANGKNSRNELSLRCWRS